MYKVERVHEGRSWYQAVVSPTGEVIRHYGDSKLRDAQELAALLNEAYALGLAARTMP